MRRRKIIYDKIDWLAEWQKNSKEPGLDVLNMKLVDDYIKRFGVGFYPMSFGAHKCPDLGRALSTAHRLGMANRFIIGSNGWGRCFPKWVYTYTFLKERTDE
jgi:hypothetical protein